MIHNYVILIFIYKLENNIIFIAITNTHEELIAHYPFDGNFADMTGNHIDAINDGTYFSNWTESDGVNGK